MSGVKRGHDYHFADDALTAARSVTTAEHQSAARCVHRHAHNPDDAQLLLQALGLETPCGSEARSATSAAVSG